MGWGRVPHDGVPKIVTRPHPIRGRWAFLKTTEHQKRVGPIDLRAKTNQQQPIPCLNNHSGV